MAERYYLSTLSKAWPIERQEALLDECAPGWRNGVVDREIVSAKERQGHSASALPRRANLLRTTTRGRTDTIVVPTLAIWAFDGADFDQSIEALRSRRAVLRALDVGRTFGPDDLEAAREAFQAGRRRAAVEIRQKAGSAVSAARQKARTAPGIEAIRDRWEWPSDEAMAKKWGFPDHRHITTKALLAEAGVTRNTANVRLGWTREEAQADYLRRLRRREARKEQKNEARS